METMRCMIIMVAKVASAMAADVYMQAVWFPPANLMYSVTHDSNPKFRTEKNSSALRYHTLYVPPVSEVYNWTHRTAVHVVRRLMAGSPRMLIENMRKSTMRTSRSSPVQ